MKAVFVLTVIFSSLGSVFGAPTPDASSQSLVQVIFPNYLG
jgi:hypothetical protein